MLLYTFIGCILLLIQLPLGWTAGYLLKTIGFALCMAGIKELAQHFDSLQNESDHDDPPVRKSGLGGIAVWRTVKNHLTPQPDKDSELGDARSEVSDMLAKNALICAAVCLTCSGIAAVFEFFVKDKNSAVSPAANLISIAMGIVSTLTALRLVYGAVTLLETNDRVARASQDRNKRFILTDNFTDILRLKSAFEKTAICTLVNLACDILNRAIPIETVQTYTGFLAAISKLTLYVFVIITALKFNEVRKGVDRKMGLK